LEGNGEEDGPQRMRTTEEEVEKERVDFAIKKKIFVEEARSSKTQFISLGED